MTDAADRDRFAARSDQNCFERMTAAVRKFVARMPWFISAGQIRRGLRNQCRKCYFRLELESLPTAGWGYDHFPLSAGYVEQPGMPCPGITGKFHRLWGEVGDFRKPDALIHQYGAMIAQGARRSIGDRLHPSTRIDASTMVVIGPTYKSVKDRQHPMRENRQPRRRHDQGFAVGSVHL